jgi:hypothetical protein
LGVNHGNLGLMLRLILDKTKNEVDLHS